ncbi:MAG: hypothetical protein CMB34_05065 [Euryarchaeota archaeon]|nr:hypothetical protein [Euryarchaeota archaeon]
MPSNSSPFSFVRYESSGTGPFAINFDYLSTSHLSVSVNGATLASSDFTVDANANTVTLASPAAAGSVIIIQRTTPKGKSGFQTDVADFSDGSVLKAEDLDQAALGLLFVAQEADDSGSANALNKDLQDNKFDAQSLHIKNVATPTTGDHAVSKQYVDGLSLYNSPTPLSVYSFNGDGTAGPYTLSPAPQSTDPKAFIVDVGGVAQRPTTDYTISGATISFGATIASSVSITVRNIGVARDTLAQPIVADGSAAALTVKEKAGQSSANLQEYQNSAGSVLAKVATDGDATFVDVNATGNVDSAGSITSTGTITSGGTLTASGILNVVGALQFNGQTGIKIHGITKFDLVDANGNPTSDTTHPIATNTVDEDAQYVISGIRATLTPQSSNSKFLILGSMAGACATGGAGPTTQSRAGMRASLILNNTPSNGRGNIHNGTRTGAQYLFIQYVQGGGFVHGAIPIQTLYEPASTSQFTLDVAFRSVREATILTSESRAVLGNRFVVAIEFS